MYTQYFSLKQSPFSIAPDPRYLFMSERHREALAHLLYGVGSGGGFVLLTGEIGAGKTTVCRCFIEQVPANCQLAYIFNPKLTVEELLQSVCEEFRIALPEGGAASVKAHVDAINRHLLASHAQGRNNVLVIDEAQNLSAEVLEQLRLLTNLETSERKLLQIILIGQPELRTMLARPELEQLAQRVIARYHLGPLSEVETGSYVAHRLAVAGAAAQQPIPRALVKRIHRLARGVPRRINLLCDRALLGAYVENEREVTRRILRKAAEEVFGDADGGLPARPVWPYMAAGVTAALVLSGAAAWHLMPRGAAGAQAAIAAQTGPSSATVQAPRSGAGLSSGRSPFAAGGSGTAGASALTASSSSANGALASSVAPAAATPAALAARGSASAAMDAEVIASSAAPAQHGGASQASGIAGRASADEALRDLAALWGQPLSSDHPCAEASKLGLRCHQGRGGLYELRLLDRPAMLALHDGAAPVSYVLLTGLTDTTATLNAAGKRIEIGVAALAARFDGEFTTFWKIAPQYREQINLRDHGADVDWLSVHLAQLNGKPAPAPGQPLDRDLLRSFQTAQNLKTDGVAGPRTYMRLNQLGGVAEPRLLAKAGK